MSQVQVKTTTHARIGDGSLHAYVAKTDLPADGLWRIRTSQSSETIRELYLMPTQPSRLQQLGKRMYAALEEKQIQNARWKVQMGYEACRQFAQEGTGLGPKAISDFKDDKRWNYVADNWGGRTVANQRIAGFD